MNRDEYEYPDELEDIDLDNLTPEELDYLGEYYGLTQGYDDSDEDDSDEEEEEDQYYDEDSDDDDD